MILHENRLPAVDSHEISYLIFFQNKERCHKFLSSAAVVIGALRVNRYFGKQMFIMVCTACQDKNDLQG